MAIEVGNKRVVDLTLQNVLYTLDLYSNLISILKVCGLDLDVQFGKDNVVAKFNNGHTTIYSISRNKLYHVKILHKPIIIHTYLIVKVTFLDN